ncbi:hypothetical protein K458DRAFT_403952 [Lentithecium fluviatile CBS 122367]|uniref:Uncharacterized protein n=1 Tax=Lentithecium fluviatile CBS 122367 TaxID=1168545 RepID=A0A6G1J192_9PLEO|nr:hypothetical protein K458DRAFT_403952 [Lentithecium fluviatile CBS 122367]
MSVRQAPPPLLQPYLYSPKRFRVALPPGNPLPIQMAYLKRRNSGVYEDGSFIPLPPSVTPQCFKDIHGRPQASTYDRWPAYIGIQRFIPWHDRKFLAFIARVQTVSPCSDASDQVANIDATVTQGQEIRRVRPKFICCVCKYWNEEQHKDHPPNKACNCLDTTKYETYGGCNCPAYGYEICIGCPKEKE